MLSKATRTKLLKFIQALGQTELQIEVLREVLCSQIQFEPYMLFKYLDKQKKGFIDSKELHRLLFLNNLEYQQDEVSAMMKSLGQSDSQWNYTDFMHIVLTTENLNLRAAVTQRPTLEMKEIQVPYEVEFAFIRIIEKEIYWFKKLNALKFQLINSEDFTIKASFSCIDTSNLGSVQPEQLAVFMIKNNLTDVPQLSVGAFRRLDTNHDGQIDIGDFKISIEPYQGVLPISSRVQKNRTDSIQQPQTAQNLDPYLFDKVSYNVSMVEQDKNTPIKKHTESNKNLKLSLIEYPNRRSMMSVQKHVVQMRNANAQRSPPGKNSVSLIKSPSQFILQDEIMYLAECLRIFCKLEDECEQQREKLALQEDFNVLDIFETFDVDQSAKLCPSDIGCALAEIEIYPSQNQLFLWVKRYDRDRDGKLNVREFVSSLLPLNEQLQSRVRQRPQRTSKGKESGVYPKKMPKTPLIMKNFLSQRTQELLCEAFKTQIENEVAIECVRQKVTKRQNFDLKKLFKYLDYDEDGALDMSDFQKVMHDNGIQVDQRLLQLLRNRFDKNSDSMVSYGEFISEIYPKIRHQV